MVVNGQSIPVINGQYLLWELIFKRVAWYLNHLEPIVILWFLRMGNPKTGWFRIINDIGWFTEQGTTRVRKHAIWIKTKKTKRIIFYKVKAQIPKGNKNIKKKQKTKNQRKKKSRNPSEPKKEKKQNVRNQIFCPLFLLGVCNFVVFFVLFWFTWVLTCVLFFSFFVCF